MRNIYRYLVVIFSTYLVSCVNETITTVVPSCELPISISAEYPIIATRANENGFVPGDGVGIFIVDYNSMGEPGELMMNGVRAANALFEYDGNRWNSSYQFYWASSTTPADFIGYYPYDMAMDSPKAHPFNVKRLQLSEDGNTTAGAGYEASDFLWAKAEKIYPTSEAIKLQYKHLMAGITVKLEMGDGFTDEEWNSVNKSVLIGKTEMSCDINLSNGNISINPGAVDMITPLSYNGTWRAVVIPQVISAGTELLVVDVDGQNYSFAKDIDMNYESGKMHNFTIRVHKREAGGDYEFEVKPASIIDWIEEPEFHEGIVREYITIHIDEPGTLQNKIDQLGYKYFEVTALKLTGVVNHTDLGFIGQNLIGLGALNIRDIKITGNKDEEDCLGGIGGSKLNNLNYIVLPRNLKKINSAALQGVGLVGAIDIPDSVEEIGWEALGGNRLTGELKLPASLKHLGGGAFSSNHGIYGQLHLPEKLETLGGYAFSGCNLSGPFILPSTLTTYEHPGFTGTCGTIVVPPKMTEIPDGAFRGTGCSKVEFHEGIEVIGFGAFGESNISGELVIPENVKNIKGEAFASSKISKIIFPESLRILGDGLYDQHGVFCYCRYLTGVIELPKNVSRIPKGCFYDCNNIIGLVIPENVDIIDNVAFHGCSSIVSIVSQSEEPPVLCKDVFYGVNKENVTVEVPKGCVNAYRQASGWSDFKRITEYSDFVCRPAQANALNTLHTEEAILNANGEWYVKECPDWITLSKREGNGKSSILVTFNEMEHGAGNRSGNIVFALQNEDYETSMEVNQYDYQYDEDSRLLLQEHTEGNGGLNIVFIGDGFDGLSISNDSYLNLVKEQVEYFFDVQPYKNLRNYFDVHVLFPLSQECGVNTMHTYVNNHFGTLYGYDGTIWTSNQLITSVDEVINYALENTPTLSENKHKSLIVLVPNDSGYDGYTIYSDIAISICPPSNRPYPQDTRGVIQHEAGGHGFGKLADESITYTAWVPSSISQAITDYHNRGWYKNISVSSKFSSVPWADFIFDTDYSDNVDIFEGAYGYMRGVFRSELNSCMNFGIPYYNTISRLEIMKRVYDYGGTQFSMDKFYEQDTFEWGSTGNTTRTAYNDEYIKGNAYTTSNSHRAPTECDDKSAGDVVRKIRKELKDKMNNN